MRQLNDGQISNLIEDIRKINSPTPEATQTKKRKTPEGYISKLEAADFLGCTPRTIDNWMKTKLIPYYKFGRLVFLKKSQLVEAIENSKVA